MAERDTRQRMMRATELYELVQLADEHLHEIQDYLEASEFEEFSATKRAKDLALAALDSVHQLKELAGQLHMRPSEDSSSGVLESD
jgi:hypothetical protein